MGKRADGKVTNLLHRAETQIKQLTNVFLVSHRCVASVANYDPPFVRSMALQCLSAHTPI